MGEQRRLSSSSSTSMASELGCHTENGTLVGRLPEGVVPETETVAAPPELAVESSETEQPLGDFGEMPDSAGFDMDQQPDGQQPLVDTADDKNCDPYSEFSQRRTSKPASSTKSNSSFINTRATPGRSGKRKCKSSQPMMDSTTTISSVRLQP